MHHLVSWLVLCFVFVVCSACLFVLLVFWLFVLFLFALFVYWFVGLVVCLVCLFALFVRCFASGFVFLFVLMPEASRLPSAYIIYFSPYLYLGLVHQICRP